jgi:hypothetical protein
LVPGGDLFPAAPPPFAHWTSLERVTNFLLSRPVKERVRTGFLSHQIRVPAWCLRAFLVNRGSRRPASRTIAANALAQKPAISIQPQKFRSAKISFLGIRN